MSLTSTTPPIVFPETQAVATMREDGDLEGSRIENMADSVIEEAREIVFNSQSQKKLKRALEDVLERRLFSCGLSSWVDDILRIIKERAPSIYEHLEVPLPSSTTVEEQVFKILHGVRVENDALIENLKNRVIIEIDNAKTEQIGAMQKCERDIKSIMSSANYK